MRRSNQFHRLLKAGVFSRRGYVMQDPDAIAYVAAVKSAGVTDAHLASLGMPSWSVSEPAIDAFVLAEKAASRWASVKLMYLPVWGIAVANATDLVTRSVGSFVGGPSYERGYAVGNGSTAYFDPGAGKETSTLGMSVGDNMLFFLAAASTGSLRAYCGAADLRVSSSNRFQIVHAPSVTSAGGGEQLLFSSTSNAAGANTAFDDLIRNGIFIGTNSATNSRRLVRNTAALGVQSVTNTFNETQALANLRPFFMARNTKNADGSDEVTVPSATKFGLYGCGTAMTNAGQEAFAASLKTLWQTITDLTIP